MRRIFEGFSMNEYLKPSHINPNSTRSVRNWNKFVFYFCHVAAAVVDAVCCCCCCCCSKRICCCFFWHELLNRFLVFFVFVLNHFEMWFIIRENWTVTTESRVARARLRFFISFFFRFVCFTFSWRQRHRRARRRRRNQERARDKRQRIKVN